MVFFTVLMLLLAAPLVLFVSILCVLVHRACGGAWHAH